MANLKVIILMVNSQATIISTQDQVRAMQEKAEIDKQELDAIARRQLLKIKAKKIIA